MTRFRFICALFLFLAQLELFAAPLRVIIETDAGGDPDDEQSFVRFLLYANEWDIEGIIANRERARSGENKNIERTGLRILRRMVQAYGECYPNLVKHDARYPKPELLLSRTVPSYGGMDQGVELLIKAIDSNDPRPVWFMNWGTDAGSAPSALKRALDHVLAERGAEGYAKFKSRLRLASDDQFADHTFKIDPPFPFWVDTFRPEIDRKRWYHQFSTITAKAGGFDLFRDCIVGHGPLGALYPTNTTHWQKEGDTMTFLYLVPTGMNDPNEPAWGSWAGRHGSRSDAAGRNYFWANQTDAWQESTNRDNTLLRWSAHLQNDFRARLDWCVSSYEEANHRPRLSLNGTAEGIQTIEARPGTTVTLNADGSTDPDGQSILFRWELYPEAGTYKGAPKIEASHFKNAVVTLPPVLGGDLHIILTGSDEGTPPLTAYRRAIIRVRN